MNKKINKNKTGDIAKNSGSLIIGVSIFLFAFFVFIKSPINQLSDSNYSMLLSQNIWDNGSFILDRYFELPLNKDKYPSITNGRHPYQIESVNGHFFYYYPVGSSVLSVPFVAFLNAYDVSVINEDDTYNLEGEREIQIFLSALLMAGFTGLLFYQARLILPLSWSILISMAGGFGTQVWSSASRALWSITWEIFFVNFVILMLILLENNRKKNMSPMLLASLLSWMYFVRPTSAISIIAVSIYIYIFYRDIFLKYILSGMAWLGVFISYSLLNFGQILPNYYMAKSFSYETFWIGFWGILVSPSRGLFFYVPFFFYILYVIVRYWKSLAFKKITILSLITILGHIVLYSLWECWWGGHCYGPRLTTEVVPWFMLLGIQATRAVLDRRKNSISPNYWVWRVHLLISIVIIGLSICINARGAIFHDTQLWNVVPTNIDIDQARLWNWRRPQFLAGIL